MIATEANITAIEQDIPMKANNVYLCNEGERKRERERVKQCETLWDRTRIK